MIAAQLRAGSHGGSQDGCLPAELHRRVTRCMVAQPWADMPILPVTCTSEAAGDPTPRGDREAQLRIGVRLTPTVDGSRRPSVPNTCQSLSVRNRLSAHGASRMSDLKRPGPGGQLCHRTCAASIATGLRPSRPSNPDAGGQSSHQMLGSSKGLGLSCIFYLQVLARQLTNLQVATRLVLVEY
jgi:hypothetical protein